MKTFLSFLLLFCVCAHVSAQTTAPVIWQINSFEVAANVQQAERTLNVVATLNATNVGGSAGRTLTVRLNSKAKVASVAIAGAAATFRPGNETRGELQRLEISLPSPVAPNASTTVTVTYALPVESNSGLESISPIGTQFLPLAFWYPMPNTPYTVRGADTAPFRMTVNLPNIISSGVEKSAANGSISFEQTLHAQPFFVQGDWDTIEGTADGKG
ncbi:MAG TPA: hypothetical protein VIK76_19155, partial [Pyrinomonadaceae bacterium]